VISVMVYIQLKACPFSACTVCTVLVVVIRRMVTQPKHTSGTDVEMSDLFKYSYPNNSCLCSTKPVL